MFIRHCCIQVAILALLLSGLLSPCDEGDSVMFSPSIIIIALFSGYWWVRLQTAKPNRIPSIDSRPHLTSRHALGKTKVGKHCSERLVPFEVECISNRFRMYPYSLVSQNSRLKGAFPHQIKSTTLWWGKYSRKLRLHLNSSKTATHTISKRHQNTSISGFEVSSCPFKIVGSALLRQLCEVQELLFQLLPNETPAVTWHVSLTKGNYIMRILVHMSS